MRVDDHPRPPGVEALRPVSEPADDERDAEHEHAVREDRADERRLDDLDEPSCSAKSAMKSSGRLPSADWTTPAPPDAEPGAELLGRGADEPREERERDRGDGET